MTMVKKYVKPSNKLN
uniref:Uncharacterized protein n=1 Tax=Rhizophora mucronata TaxID=61149 RepID=A0A2P2PY77_RHIMU